jgi:hypothetical protein
MWETDTTDLGSYSLVGDIERSDSGVGKFVNRIFRLIHVGEQFTSKLGFYFSYTWRVLNKYVMIL